METPENSRIKSTFKRHQELGQRTATTALQLAIKYVISDDSLALSEHRRPKETAVSHEEAKKLRPFREWPRSCLGERAPCSSQRLEGFEENAWSGPLAPGGPPASVTYPCLPFVLHPGYDVLARRTQQHSQTPALGATTLSLANRMDLGTSSYRMTTKGD